MILHGDSLNELKTLDTDSIDFVCTDPPYGYSFMGKDWDKAVPSVEIWQECLRVLKPGAFCCVMSAPRSDVQNAMISRLMEAGFRLDFTPIYWTYASGFPKAGNIGKLVDKRLGAEREKLAPNPNARLVKRDTSSAFERPVDTDPDADMKHITIPASNEAKALDGSYAGFQPKPAVEVIIVAMKPLSEKTYVDQALKNGKGISWLDDARIPTTAGDYASGGQNNVEGTGWGHKNQERTQQHESGRFPANLLVSDDVLNDGRNYQSGGAGTKTTKEPANVYGTYNERVPGAYRDKGSYSRFFDLDKWHERNIDDNNLVHSEVVNSITSVASDPHKNDIRNYGEEVDENIETSGFKTFPFLIVPKASKREKNEGLEHLPKTYSSNTEDNPNPVRDIRPDIKTANHHPTVKPLKLMSYLITLFSREGDTVLDPFVGSGTTILAAKQLNRNGIGIEREAEYVEIARARLEAVKEPNPTLL